MFLVSHSEGTSSSSLALGIFCNFSNDVYQIIQFGFHTKHFLCEMAKGPRTKLEAEGVVALPPCGRIYTIHTPIWDVIVDQLNRN